MARVPDRYERKLSDAETRDNYIMIMKDAVKMFPKTGRPFKLKIGETNHEVRVTAVECWCQGPRTPHRHFRIDTSELTRTSPLRWGDVVVIEKVSDEEYTMTIHKK